MNKILIWFILGFVITIIYCEQRYICYTEVKNKVSKSSSAVYFQNATSVFTCAVQCSEDVCCARFIYNEISKQCIGIHRMKKYAYTYQQVPPLSEITRQYQPGCDPKWVEFRGHSYFFGNQTARWLDAKLECQNMCSYLVEIGDRDEADWLARTFLNKGDCPSNLFQGCVAWTGGNDLDIEGQYVWDHSNTSLVYTNWHTDEPSLADPSLALSRDCIDILRNGKWNDRPCSYFNSYICEKSLDL